MGEKKYGRRHKLFLIASMLLIASACGADNGSKEGSNSDIPQGSKEEVENKAKDPVQLSFYFQAGGWTEERFMEIFGNKIKAKFPHITPKLILQTKGTLDDFIASGEKVDIWFNTANAIFGSNIKFDFQYDMSDLIKIKNYDLKRLEPTAVERMRGIANGGLYGLPYSAELSLLYYNKDIFDKFGVSYPKDGMTWDDIYPLAKSLSRNDGGVLYRGLRFNVAFGLLYNQLSAAFVDPKTNNATLQTDNWRKVIDNMTRFYQIPGNEATVSQITSPLKGFFEDKDTAMFVGNSANAENIWELTKTMNWDAVQLPFFKDASGIGSQSEPWYAEITRQSKNKEAAFEVVDYLTSDEIQTQLARKGIVPITVNPEIIKLFGKDNPVFQGKNIHAFIPWTTSKPASAPVKTKFDSITQPKLYAWSYKIIAGGIDMNTGLRSAQEEAEKAINEEKSK